MLETVERVFLYALWVWLIFIPAAILNVVSDMVIDSRWLFTKASKTAH